MATRAQVGLAWLRSHRRYTILAGVVFILLGMLLTAVGDHVMTN